MHQPSSNIFEGFKSVGNVTGPLPFIVRHGKTPKDTRIISIVGKTFQTYTTNLTLVEVSIPHEFPISALTCDLNSIYCASGRSILVWGRGSKILRLRLDNGHQAEVKFVAKTNYDKLVAVDEDNVLFHWSTKDKEILNIINFDEGNFEISALCHPNDYIDKILLGSKQGPLQLWNVADERHLYTFKGWQSAVTCLSQSPVNNVVAIGLEDGHIYIHNLKYDEVIMKMYQEYGAVTSMTFRLDKQPYLVTASEIGHLMIWNLERKRLSSQIRNAHGGPIIKCQFIRNEALLVTSGKDNSIKIWGMHLSDGGGTLLCQRCGHGGPPNQIKFYGSKGFNLLSAGEDSTIKMFHLYSERLNRNLGTARLNPRSKDKSTIEKLPPVVCFAAEAAKEKQWDNIAACHRNSSIVTTWNYDKCKMGKHIISQPTFERHDVSASSICITGCGNFVVIGFSNGIIFKYNIQSGLFRQYFETTGLSEHRAHDGTVSGLDVDSLDLVLVSAGHDSKLKVWNFKSGLLLMTEDLPSPIIKLDLHRENNLLALGLKDKQINIMDLEARNMIRKFDLPSTLLDMTFSPDSKWLLTSFEDCSIRTWDLSLGKIIDAFKLSSPCVSMSMSPTGEFLATAHRDSLGINIWCNYTIYCPAIPQAINYDTETIFLDMPFVHCDEQYSEDQESEDKTRPELASQTEPTYTSPLQLHNDLITMSGLPSSRWKNLLNVDEIRKRQMIEDEERHKKPVKVPFFIPIKDGLQPQLDTEVIEELHRKEMNDSNSMRSKLQGLEILSEVAQCLVEGRQTNDYSTFLSRLKELGPSQTDAEIRSMGSDTCGNHLVMLCFLDAIDQAFTSRLDYELASAWLALFLKAHSDLIQSDGVIKQRCLRLLNLVRNDWNRLNENFNQIFCVLNFIRTSII